MSLTKINSPYYGMPLSQVVDIKRSRRMSEIDNLPPATRELVHDYGFTVVKAFLAIGITKPRQIKHLVETVLNEFSPTRGSNSIQGIRTREQLADKVSQGDRKLIGAE